MKTSYLNGAFTFDYTKEKPELTIKINDELQWLCVTQNVTVMRDLTKITDDWEDGVTPAGFFANDTSMDCFEQNLKESGLSKAEYLAQWGLTEKQFEKLQERIFKKYEDGLGFNMPMILADSNTASYVAGVHPDFDYAFDPYYNGYYDLDFNMDFMDDETTFLWLGLEGRDEEALQRAKENDGILVVNDDMFNEFKSYLPHIFEIGAMGHWASMTAEWLPTNLIEDLFVAKCTDGSKFAKNGKLTYQGSDSYKDEYARYLIQKACLNNDIKLELDVSYDSIKNDENLAHRYGGEINWDGADDGIYDMSKNQILRFYDKDDELKRVYFTSSGQFDNAQYIARKIMSKDDTIAYATADLQGDVAGIARIDDTETLERVNSELHKRKNR